MQSPDQGESAPSGGQAEPVAARQDPALEAPAQEPPATAGETAGSTTAPREDSRAVPPPPVETAPAPAATDSPLSITDYGVGTGVANRMLTGRGDRFPYGTQVWFWTRTVGGTRGDILTHVWIHEDGQVISYERTLGGARRRR